MLSVHIILNVQGYYYNDVELLILIDISTALRLKHEEICKIVKTYRQKYNCQWGQLLNIIKK